MSKARNSLKLNEKEKYMIHYGTENWDISLIGIANCKNKKYKIVKNMLKRISLNF